jgi:FixJ family two-component response regulator
MRTVMPILRTENGQNGPGRVLVLGRTAAAEVQRAVTGLAAEIWVVDAVDELLSCVDENAWGCLVADPHSFTSEDQVRICALTRDWPGFPFIVWSPAIELRSAIDALKQGAFDVLQSPMDEAILSPTLAEALRSGRERHEAWRATREMAKRFEQLSLNERSVLALVLQGRTNKEISTQLDFSLRTVEARRQRILKTMQAENAIDLAVLLARHGLVDEALTIPSRSADQPHSASA